MANDTGIYIAIGFNIGPDMMRKRRNVKSCLYWYSYWYW